MLYPLDNATWVGAVLGDAGFGVEVAFVADGLAEMPGVGSERDDVGILPSRDETR